MSRIVVLAPSLVTVLLVVSPTLQAQGQSNSASQEFLVLFGTGVMYIATPDGRVSTGGRSRRFNEYAFASAIAADGRIFTLNACPRLRDSVPQFPGLATALLRVDSVLKDTDFAVRRDPRWDAVRPSYMRVSADGKLLAFISDEPDKSAAIEHGYERIFVLDLASGEMWGITSFRPPGPFLLHEAPRVDCFNWAPDGKRIAFYCHVHSSYVDSLWEPELYVVDMTGNQRRIAESSKCPRWMGSDLAFGPLWAPDGSTVFFVASYEEDRGDREEGFPMTYSVPAAGGQRKKLCDGTPTSVTPDGRYLFASIHRALGPGDAEVHLRLELATQRTEDLGVDWVHALVSPSGQYVACTIDDCELGMFTIAGEELARIPRHRFVGGSLRVGMSSTFWVHAAAERPGEEDGTGRPKPSNGASPEGEREPGAATGFHAVHAALVGVAAASTIAAIFFLIRRSRKRAPG